LFFFPPHREASTLLKTDGTSRSQFISEVFFSCFFSSLNLLDLRLIISLMLFEFHKKGNCLRPRYDTIGLGYAVGYVGEVLSSPCFCGSCGFLFTSNCMFSLNQSLQLFIPHNICLGFFFRFPRSPTFHGF
jgi:hypothetical protein